MKQFVWLSLLLAANTVTLAQQKKFDLASYTPLKGWQQQTTAQYIQFTKEDKMKNTFCIITLYKSVDAGTDAVSNFNAAWESLVKESLTITEAPQMQPAATENGWDLQSGLAPFEKDGIKGAAMLISASGYSKLMNLLILTNTDLYQTQIDGFISTIQLNRPANTTTKNSADNKPATPSPATDKTGYSFTTTNFDDGWTAVAQEDWVEVTKGSVKVLLHYPKEGTVFPADVEVLVNAAWNILVAPRYSTLRNYRTTYVSAYVRPYLGMGYAQERATGKEMFVLLFRQSNGWIECVAPDKNSFIEAFKFDPETIRYDSETDLLKTVDVMTNYNKFALAAADLEGSGLWTNSFSNNTFYTNIYTGSSAGMSTYTSGEEYTFLKGGKYNWYLAAANSYGGKTDFATGKGEGSWKLNGNWQINFHSKAGKTKRYNAFFSCLKGARLLHLLDADYPGSGIYTAFGKDIK